MNFFKKILNAIGFGHEEKRAEPARRRLHQESEENKFAPLENPSRRAREAKAAQPRQSSGITPSRSDDYSLNPLTNPVWASLYADTGKKANDDAAPVSPMHNNHHPSPASDSFTRATDAPVRDDSSPAQSTYSPPSESSSPSPVSDYSAPAGGYDSGGGGGGFSGGGDVSFAPAWR